MLKCAQAHQGPGEAVTQVFPQDDVLDDRPVVRGTLCTACACRYSAGASHAAQPGPETPA